MIRLLPNKIYKNLLKNEFNALSWYICSQIKYIKMYWDMNLIFFFCEKFNALLWYVCSQIKYINFFSYFSIFSKPESIQSSWSRNSAQPFRFVCLLTFYYELLIIHKAFLTQLSFYIVPRIYPFFLKKIKINKIKSIGKISGKKQHCTMKNHNH